MPGFILKQAFQEELKSVTQQIDSWALDFIDASGRSQSTALLLKGTGEDKAGELKELLKNLEKEHGRLHAAIGEQKNAMLQYNEWIAHVKDKDVQLAERITQLLESKRRGEDKVSVAMADISSKLDYRKQKLDALRKATSWYKELLGIRCEYSNAVRFIFTNIDQTNPDREFSFSIHHDKLANRFSKKVCAMNLIHKVLAEVGLKDMPLANKLLGERVCSSICPTTPRSEYSLISKFKDQGKSSTLFIMYYC